MASRRALAWVSAGASSERLACSEAISPVAALLRARNKGAVMPDGSTRPIHSCPDAF
jgi:hypothetical protein